MPSLNYTTFVRLIYKPHGASYGEWSARWWQWGVGQPAATNPISDPTGEFCAEGQSGHVWFLAGTFGGAATRTCAIPTGTSLFFPILNTLWGAPVDCPGGAACDIDALRAAAAAAMNNPTTLQVEVDGVALQNLAAYRAASPAFSITPPNDNLFGIDAGTYSPLVSDGYWVMLTPLRPGPHTIHILGVDSGGFQVDVTYNLTVVPGRG